MGFLGFSLIQATKATGIPGHIKTLAAIVDTSINNDSLVQNSVPINDPKQGFTSLFTTAVTGDGANGARLNPMAITFVENYIARNRKGFLSMKEWARPYLEMMDVVLTQHGLPKGLKYLAVIESGLKYNALSWSGAVGPWALMPAAAKQYGLTVSRNNDERLDYYKSTHAAASLLTDLYARYGDWLLVIAAYNGGPGNVDKAIRKSGGSKDFWTFQYYLPNESMNHVKKFIATHYIMEGEGGVTTVTKNEMKDIVLSNNVNLNEDELANSRVQLVTGRYSSSVISLWI
jgi:membrane-bound lytic murein transglycosylase D